MRCREKFSQVQLRLVEGLRHLTGPMVRDGRLDMALAPRPQPGGEDPAIRFKPIAHFDLIVVARRDHPLAQARSGAALASPQWLCSLRRDAGSQALRALGVPQPFLDMPQVAEGIQQIPIAERLPGLTVGLHTRADAPLTRPAAALARLLRPRPAAGGCRPPPRPRPRSQGRPWPVSVAAASAPGPGSASGRKAGL